MDRRGFFRLIGRAAALGVAAKVVPGLSIGNKIPGPTVGGTSGKNWTIDNLDTWSGGVGGDGAEGVQGVTVFGSGTDGDVTLL